jgi:hypothetical protein
MSSRIDAASSFLTGTTAARGQGPAAPADDPTLLDLATATPRPWPATSDVALAVVVFVAHLIIADGYYSILTRACSGAEAALLVLLITRYIRVQPPRLPWLEFLFGVYYTQFGLPTIGEPTPVGFSRVLPSSDSFNFASVLALACGLALIGGFAAGLSLFRKVSGDRFLPRIDIDTLVRASPLHLGLAAIYILGTTFVPSAHHALLSIANFASALLDRTPIAIVAVLAYLLRPRMRSALLLLGALAVLAIGLAVSSMLNEALLPLAALGTLWWRGRGRIPWIAGGAAALVLLVLQPVKGFYREIHWQDPNTSVIESWQSAFSESAHEASSPFAQGPVGAQASVSRLGELPGLAYTVELVPNSIPHTGGQVYGMLLVGAIPRFLWPEKPDMTKYSLDPFTIALGLTSETEAASSTTGITLPDQGYLEHGIPGSLAWMVLLGLMAAFVSRYFGSKLAGILPGAACLMPLGLASGGGFSACFGSLWQMLLGGTLLSWLVWVLGRGWTANRQTSSITDDGTRPSS